MLYDGVLVPLPPFMVYRPTYLSSSKGWRIAGTALGSVNGLLDTGSTLSRLRQVTDVRGWRRDWSNGWEQVLVERNEMEQTGSAWLRSIVGRVIFLVLSSSYSIETYP